ncbi:plasmid stabilization system protein ParE [Winogradskyella epiphytica]|uniref:Plasmid stabilization system protein ParE n=1 Tax=Winogradskyella epiphytica TaxID=262005 RepID=A0A2V4XPT1_9FLAO|nr:type II toxin-antitoxin system RelE/ParE family toxin [Winogradskyella epiphytica]PYE79003.1 plasmid stabilization system protein ParE [Winogradskyella epiphytica]GGW74783.1 plasmid stabilization protein [Winogradskyella epiphytica]
MKVYLSELAESKLLKISDYLLENWDLKTRDKFIEKLSEKIKQISIQPQSCPKSSEVKGLYKCVVTKQTTLYYRISIELREIEVITIFDTRQSPENLKKDIK